MTMSDVLIGAAEIVAAEERRASRDIATQVHWRLARDSSCTPTIRPALSRARAWWEMLPEGEKEQIVLLAIAVGADLVTTLVRRLFNDNN